MRSIVPSKKVISTTYGHGNALETDEEFNELFVNVGKRTYERTQSQLSHVNSDQEASRYNAVHEHLFRPDTVVMNTVILTLKRLKNTSSVGSDGISLQHIRDSLPVIDHYLTTIINTSIVTGNFPSAWKHATVTSIFKSSDRNDVNNYRSISLLPVLSNVLEKIVVQQLSAFLESNQILSKTQHGFIPQLSTETALITLTNKLYSNMDNKKLSLVTLLGLSKAFASVHHVTLLEKLTKAQEDTFWFSHYLKDRSQMVQISNATS